MIETWYEENGMVTVDLAGLEVQMKREEAEELFVRLGHTLNDLHLAMDGAFDNYSDGEQP